jgi:uncharacterized protein YdhG (YjbR/CyaY superfamily)
MARTDYQTVSEYIASRPKPAQAVLRRVRSVIRKAVPDADEVISYQIPAYKLRGRIMLYFAAWKHHYSLYPANERLVSAFRDELTPYEFNNKGTIRFPLLEPVPEKLIAAIARFRAREVAELEKDRTAQKKRPHVKKRS